MKPLKLPLTRLKDVVSLETQPSIHNKEQPQKAHLGGPLNELSGNHLMHCMHRNVNHLLSLTWDLRLATTKT